MKKSWVLFTAIGVFSIAIGFLTACGNQHNNAASSCVGPQCLNAYGLSQNPYGMNAFTAQTQSQYSGGYGGGYAGYGSPQVGTLQLQTGFRSLLKEAMGTCDLNHANGGTAACDSYMSGISEVSFSFTGSTANTVTLYIKSQPGYNPNFNYYYSLPSAGQFALNMLGIPTYQTPQMLINPMSLGNATLWPVNNNAGFEIRANGPQGSWAWNKLLQLQVLSGKIEDATFAFNLYYNGQLAASGTMVRCQAGATCLTGM